METAEGNQFLTQVGKGTPMGNLMRRYWQPAALLDEALALARRIAAQPGHALRMTKRLMREAQTQRLDTLLELSAPVFCDHVLVGPERFVMHPNTLASLRVVSPATHDYTDFARWLNPDQLQGTLIVLLFGDTMSLDSPLQESYVHRELLRITQKMTVQEYVTMCLCELYVAQQREYHVVVDVQWLRRRGLVLLDEQLDASNTLRAYVVQCLCHNLVVTYTAHDPAEDGLVVDGETRRWRDVQLRHRLHKEQIRQL